MLTLEEKEEIINAAVERTLLSIPEVIGNLMANHAALHKINLKFYQEHPEFRGKKDVVQSIVEMVEGKNPLLSYEEILTKAVPEIKQRLLIMGDLNMTEIKRDIPRDFSHVDLSPNGVL